MSNVRILNGSLEDDEELDQIVLRGVIDQATLKYIGMAWYQRERGFSTAHINEIISAYYIKAKISDVTIGMRGERFQSAKDVFTLQDKCFVIDGGQRLYAASVAIHERPDIKINLGAKVIFNTTEEFENDLFCKLGTTQIRISPSVLIRNRRKKSPAANVLVSLDKDDNFILKDRVGWDQRKSRYDLMTGFSLSRIAGSLHGHKSGSLKSNKLYDLVKGLDDLVLIIGEETLRDNMIKFFNAIDKCWSIRQLSSWRDGAPHLKPLFLLTIARLFSRYPEFWDGKERNELYFGDKYVRKLRGFKLANYVVTKSVPRDVLFEVLRKQLQLNAINEAPDADEEVVA